MMNLAKIVCRKKSAKNLKQKDIWNHQKVDEEANMAICLKHWQFKMFQTSTQTETRITSRTKWCDRKKGWKRKFTTGKNKSNIDNANDGQKSDKKEVSFCLKNVDLMQFSATIVVNFGRWCSNEKCKRTGKTDYNVEKTVWTANSLNHL